MNIVVYTLTWNEEAILPHFLDHYGRFAQRIVVADNDSTDGTRAVVEARDNVELRRLDTGEEAREDLQQQYRNNVWKECRGTDVDYVIVVDADEFVHHPDLSGFLADHRHISVFTCLGFEMVGEVGPGSEPIDQQYTHGCRSHFMNKPSIFDPNRITEINYRPGSHSCDPEGDIVRFGPSDELKLLHHKYLGFDHVMNRHRHYQRRLSRQNLANGWGVHYGFPAETIARNLVDLTAGAEPVYGRP